MPSGAQDEADAAHGVQHARLAVGLELAAQVADEDVGHVRARIEGVAPDLLVQAARGRGPRRDGARRAASSSNSRRVRARSRPPRRAVKPAGSSSMSPAASALVRGARAGGAAARAGGRTTSSSANGLTT